MKRLKLQHELDGSEDAGHAFAMAGGSAYRRNDPSFYYGPSQEGDDTLVFIQESLGAFRKSIVGIPVVSSHDSRVRVTNLHFDHGQLLEFGFPVLRHPSSIER